MLLFCLKKMNSGDSAILPSHTSSYSHVNTCLSPTSSHAITLPAATLIDIQLNYLRAHMLLAFTLSAVTHRYPT